MKKILLGKQCWLDHISLDLSNWRVNQTVLSKFSNLIYTLRTKDPPGIKVRASLGLGAADYLIADYWVWAKMIENLSDLDYDENSMTLFSYDWRLPFEYLQERDFYFTKLKLVIETLKYTNNEKVILMSHSMGGVLANYFFGWLQQNAPTNWAEEHLQSWIK